MFKHQKFENVEHMADMVGLCAAVILGVVMIVGLLTASGHVTW